jgi:hypothetical protein
MILPQAVESGKEHKFKQSKRRDIRSLPSCWGRPGVNDSSDGNAEENPMEGA